LLAVLCSVLVGAGLALLAAPTAAAQPPDRPTAVVALGDSAASGEGAGSYEAGTRGEGGDWCHRSTNAYIVQTGLAEHAVNLACSGAQSADVAFGPGVHYTEGSQAQRLVEVAKRYRVTAVVLQVGANDDPAFGDVVVSCVAAWLNPLKPGCSAGLASQWPARVAAMAPKVEQAVTDVREAMRRAKYDDSDYTFVLASYASPVTEKMVALHGVRGCPFRVEDAKWGRTVAVPQLSAGLRGVADRTGVRFLDLSRATEDREACSHQLRSQEWQRRLAVSPTAFATGGLAASGHLAQESFHPNAAGQTQVGGCLGEFVRSADNGGQCLVGPDGQLHSVASTAVPAPA
jgi:lysophospholipase L1-like esterase